MRVLCLHGQGSSASIFESQLSRLIAALPPHWTFDFVDSPIDCGPGLDVGGVYPGPYYCFFESYSPERMNDAIDYIHEIVEEDGPYEAIIAFSQGASVTAAYLSTCCSVPHNQPPCAIAVFLCTALVSPSLASGAEKFEETVGSLVFNGPLPLPTVHVLGVKDPCFPQSVRFWETCSAPGLVQPLHFPGGHKVPKDALMITRIRDAVEKAARAAFSG